MQTQGSCSYCLLKWRQTPLPWECKTSSKRETPNFVLVRFLSRKSLAASVKLGALRLPCHGDHARAVRSTSSVYRGLYLKNEDERRKWSKIPMKNRCRDCVARLNLAEVVWEQSSALSGIKSLLCISLGYQCSLSAFKHHQLLIQQSTKREMAFKLVS